MRRLPVVAPSALPPLYDRWMRALLEAPLPRETEATCDDCAMLPSVDLKRTASSHATFFEPSTKCCTFLPALPNFLVGRVLTADDGPGRRSVEARLDARLGVSPLGVGLTPAFIAAYKVASTREFGHARTLRCPHQLDDGRCGIWRHRNSTCATWYCKHVRGEIGARFWQDGLHPLLAAVEEALARHAVAELGIGDVAIRELFQAPREAGETRTFREPRFDAVEPSAYAKRWGTWHGRERDFFVQAARITERLTWPDVLSLSGPSVRLLAESTRALHVAVRSRALPARLAVGAFRIVAVADGVTTVEGYSNLDPIQIPTGLLSVLHHFDGGPTKAARAALTRDGYEVDTTFLRTLVDFGVLIQPA